MDLTPRTNDEGSAPSKKKRRWMPIVIVVAAMSAGGVVVTKFLTSAIDYYCNVDEIGVRSGCEESRRHVLRHGVQPRENQSCVRG